MATEDQVALLRQGVGTWNAWRKESNPDEIDLVEANLGGASLAKANLIRANLDRANLSGAILTRANLSEAKLIGAVLRRATLRGAVVKAANLSGGDFNTAALCGADFSRANLSGASLDRAFLSKNSLFTRTLFVGVNLRGASLKRAVLSGAVLNGADLSDADLSGADFSEAYFVGANLSRTNLSGANFCHAHLQGADLRRANIGQTNLSGADMDGANFSEVFMFGTVLGNMDLSKSIGLNTCIHNGPSNIDYLTLRRSGPLPLAFLRGVGLPESLIDYLPSLLTQPIQMYSCFISYSSKDQDFADRLHADLQNKGVRCWFAPHDLAIGAKTWDAIDEAIRLRDKLLLILSQNSIVSDWVEDEVNKAFAEERSRKLPVLFPVRIDDTVMDTSEPWAVKLRDQRNIGDFRRWKDHDSYQNGLRKLVRDLTIVGSKPA